MAYHILTLGLLAFAKQGLATMEDRPLDIAFDSGTRGDHNEVCWERCFQVEDTDYERFREIYDDFYRMGMEARRLKNMYAVNGTAILLDSTLEAFHGDPTLNLDNEDQADSIFEFQKNLARIVVMLMGSDNSHNPSSLLQFNELDSYTCTNFHCLDTCEANMMIRDYMDPIQTLANSHRDGNVEAACGQAKRYIQTTTCEANTQHEMAIAILNSDIHFERALSSESMDSSSSSSSSSSESWEHGQGPCFAHFDTRFAIGTHSAGWHEINKFSTSQARGFYIHDNEYTMRAASNLVACLDTRCCPTEVLTIPVTWWDTTLTPGDCKITTDKYGATETDYDAHFGES